MYCEIKLKNLLSDKKTYRKLQFHYQTFVQKSDGNRLGVPAIFP